MKYTRSQLDRMFTTGGLRPMARRRLPEYRFLIPVAVFIVALVVIVLTASHLPGGW